jgi:hypothetical protein
MEKRYFHEFWTVNLRRRWNFIKFHMWDKSWEPPS